MPADFYRVAEGRSERLASAAGYGPVERPPGVLLLSDVKLAGRPLAGNGSASLWDLGDGVACLEFHAKMNALDTEIMTLIEESVGIVGRDMKALVIHNEGSNFSVGMNLGLALFAINVGAWPMIEETIKRGQDAFNALKFAPFPVVGAPSGMALGGGCEILLHCDAVQAHAETYMGLVEAGVGIVPGWGGCKEMMLRGLASKRQGFGGPMMAISRVFETIGLAKVSRSAKEARGSASCATATASPPTATACWPMRSPGRWRSRKTTRRRRRRRSGCPARPAGSRFRWRSRGSPRPARRRPTTSWWWTVSAPC